MKKKKQRQFTLPKKIENKGREKSSINSLNNDTSAYQKTLNRLVLLFFFSFAVQIIIMCSVFQKPKTMKCAYRYTYNAQHTLYMRQDDCITITRMNQLR